MKAYTVFGGKDMAAAKIRYRQLNKTTASHTSALQKVEQKQSKGTCPPGLFFATFPYRFQYRFVIVPDTSAGCHFVVHVNCKQLQHMDQTAHSVPSSKARSP